MREVNNIRHRIPLLPPGATTVRAGFISDIHLGPTTPRRLVDAAFDHLASSDLDVLLLGGDYVFLDATETKARELAARVREVPAKTKLAASWATTTCGRTTLGLLERALGDAGVEILINRNSQGSALEPVSSVGRRPRRALDGANGRRGRLSWSGGRKRAGGPVSFPRRSTGGVARDRPNGSAYAAHPIRLRPYAWRTPRDAVGARP